MVYLWQCPFLANGCDEYCGYNGEQEAQGLDSVLDLFPGETTCNISFTGMDNG